jgi:hypothetical protein
MSTLDLEKGWEPYDYLMPTGKMVGAIEKAAKFASEPALAVLPSIRLLPDGPKIVFLYLITKSFISEVTPNGEQFDYVDRRRVIYLHWQLGTAQRQDGPDAPIISLDTARCFVHHGKNNTELDYVGTQRQRWIDSVLVVLPPSIVLGRATRKVTG